MSPSLNDKQVRFCNEYLKDYNATKAAIRAGYSKKTAKQIGNRLLTYVDVQKFLQSKKKKLAEKFEITQERTIQEIGRIAYQDARRFFDQDGNLIPIHELDDDAAAVLAGMEIDEITEWEDGKKKHVGYTKKIKRWDKNKGLEMLGRYFGIFEKDNSQSKPELFAPLSDSQVDKIISALRETKTP